ncbi:tyrosine-type recombinase/integrase [Flavobacterium microcysteis]|uniref:Integrase n=1 Tax=Flavobacterium microcysteis TaxID=2596891 RepID=A0A501QAI7_9FLAO|nr:tyrosine-type recombinase/integrase [Flavobacterium microcysteis]TPD69909.1 integrase [Flavobacterium microcysteis]
MAKIYYYSIYADKIQEYVRLKHKLGYQFKKQEYHLKQLDRFASLRGETSVGFTKAFSDDWEIKKNHETERNRYIRVSILLHFSSYLRDIGYESYLPKLPAYKRSTYMPYIFSKIQIEALYKAADELRAGRNTSMNTCIMAIPAILRILASTGIRIGEVINIKISDIIHEDQCLKICDVKNGKERLIPISKNLLNVIESYKKFRNLLPEKNIQSEYLFIKLDGRRCTANGIRRWFSKSVQMAKIRESNPGHTPRVHDLRHSFAVNSLASMVADGIDLYVSLPILSNYMGHQNIQATEYYVRLTKNMFPDLSDSLDSTCIDIFPKFKNYE